MLGRCMTTVTSTIAVTASRRLVPAAVGLVSTTTSLGLVVATTLCQPRIPPRFGGSVIRSNHSSWSSSSSSSSDMDLQNRKDCPLCQKFSQGPCGDLFQTWLDCTDRYVGKDEHGQDLHLEKCQSLFEPFTKCIEKHEAYYDRFDDDAALDDDAAKDDEDELLEAWNKVIAEVETSHKAIPFPSTLEPDLQVRLANNTGMVSLVYENKGSKIVMCHVRDGDTNEVLAAGSSEDLWEYDGKGILRLSFSSSCRSMTVYALYNDENNQDALYRFTQFVPR